MSRAVSRAAIAVVGAAGLLAWMTLAPDAPPPQRAARQVPDTPAWSPSATVSELPSIEPALARPPFSPGRRPPGVTQPTLAAAEAPVPVAIATGIGSRIVLLRVPGSERLVRARAGDRIGGWQVLDVLADRITLLDPAGMVHGARLRPPPPGAPAQPTPSPAATPPALAPPLSGAELVGAAGEAASVAASSLNGARHVP